MSLPGHWEFRLPLRARLLLALLVAALVPVLVTWGVGMEAFVSRLEQRSQERLAGAQARAEIFFMNHIGRVEDLTERLAGDPTLRAGLGSPRLRDTLDLLRGPWHWAVLQAFDTQGRQLAASLPLGLEHRRYLLAPGDPLLARALSLEVKSDLFVLPEGQLVVRSLMPVVDDASLGPLAVVCVSMPVDDRLVAEVARSAGGPVSVAAAGGPSVTSLSDARDKPVDLVRLSAAGVLELDGTTYALATGTLRDAAGLSVASLAVGIDASDLMEARLWTRAFLGVGGVGAVLLAVLLGHFLIRSVERPLSLVRAAMRQMSGGALEARVAAEGVDELGRLASSFNELAEAMVAGRREVLLSAQRLEDSYRFLEEQSRELEGLVAWRTRALDASNRMLREEVRERARSEAELTALLQAMTDLIFVVDGEGVYLKVVREGEGGPWLSRKDSEAAGGRPRRVPDSAWGEMLRSAALEVLEHGRTARVEFSIEHPDGQHWFDVSISRLDEGSAVCVARDVTGARRAGAELRGLLAAMSDLVFIMDCDGRFVGAYPEDDSRFLMPRKSFLGRLVSDVLPEDVGGRIVTAAARVLASGVTERVEYSLELPGGLHWFEAGISSMDGRATLALVRDISARKRGEEELARAKELAEAASKAKSEFLASMSHEIRTPLGVVLGMADLLAESGLSGEQRAWLEALRTSGEGLLALISDILDLSRIEAGRMDVRRVAFEPRGLAEECCLVVRARAEAKGLELTRTVEPGIPAVALGDRDRLRQVLLNLLDNAVKFTARGTVSLALRHLGGAGGRVLFTVSDTGLGIPETDRVRIFDRFTQVEGVGCAHGGTGLGLAICASLAALMGGSLAVAGNPGGGSVFSLELDLPPAPSVQPGADRLPPAARLGGCRVLVAEDSENNRMLVRAYLQGTGCELVFAEDGAEAVARFDEGGFDIVLMDMLMPVMDGLAATRAIRGLEGARGAAPVPIVALTANAFEEDEQRCMGAGCTAYLAKPFRKAALLAAIEACVAARARN